MHPYVFPEALPEGFRRGGLCFLVRLAISVISMMFPPLINGCATALPLYAIQMRNADIHQRICLHYFSDSAVLSEYKIPHLPYVIQ